MDILARLIATVLVPIFAPPLTRMENALAEHWRAFRSQSWPMAFGKIHQVEVSQPQQIWIATLAYSYEVAGEFYSGFLRLNFGREQDADSFSHRFPRGMPIFVRAKPGKPEVSVMRLSENLQAPL